MSEFIRPQVQVEEINETSARVSVEPLERGYGDTLGNSLRRVLLSSLEGAAVEAIQIDGAQHEFMTIPNRPECQGSCLQGSRHDRRGDRHHLG